MGFNKIKCIDTFLGMSEIEDNSIDLIFADPPYWMRVEGKLQRANGTDFNGCDDKWDNQFNSLYEYEQFTEKWLKECRRILKKNGAIWVIGSMQCIYSIGAVMQKLGFWIINDVIWHKTNPTPNFKGTRLNNSHETLIWATKNEKSKYTFNYKTAKELNTDNVDAFYHALGERKQLGSVWRMPVCQGSERIKDDDGIKLHNTQKPEEMLRRIIAISTKLDDIVFDPFGGTFTTSAVAKSMGRQYLSFDNNEKYYEYGKRRLSQVKTIVTDVELATFDIKPLKAPLKDIISVHYLQAGENFYLKNGISKAVLCPDGKIIIDGKELDIHSGASLVLNKTNKVNGFNYWYVRRNKKLVSILKIRDEYRQMLEGNTVERYKKNTY